MCRSCKYISPPATFCLYEERPKIEEFCYLLIGVIQSPLSRFDGVKKERIFLLLEGELFSNLEILSPQKKLYIHLADLSYYHGKCSNELHCILPALLIFSNETDYLHIVVNNTHISCIRTGVFFTV